MEQVRCCACAEDMTYDANPSYIKVSYTEPGNTAENTVVAIICTKCSTEANTPTGFPIIELMINARITRVNNPGKSFKK